LSDEQPQKCQAHQPIRHVSQANLTGPLSPAGPTRSRLGTRGRIRDQTARTGAQKSPIRAWIGPEDETWYRIPDSW
jgi:hypothetical protein